DIAVEREHAAADFCGGVVLGTADVAGDDLGALAYEHPHRSLGHARTRTGDDRHLAVQQPHATPLFSLPVLVAVRCYSCHYRTDTEMEPTVTVTRAQDLYYDPYDIGINADPYPVFKRLREEAPLYYNDRHDFFAVSRYDDVERGLRDRETFISGRGGILELIKSGIEMPPGIVIFEDPPTHTIHRGLLSRMFTPRKVL